MNSITIIAEITITFRFFSIRMIAQQLQENNSQRLVAKKIIFTMVYFANLGMENDGCQVTITLEILENFRDDKLLE